MRFLRFILLFAPLLFHSQEYQRALINPQSFSFRNSVYVHGFKKNGNELRFQLYSFSRQLTKADSTEVSIGKENPENYLSIHSDTLHGYLNFYLQKVNNKNQVTLIRLNDSLKLIVKEENLEISKINSLTAFENEHYTFKNSTYTIRSTEDSLGRQYFLTKYSVINAATYFQYKENWQFPLEKRNINSVKIIYAGTSYVFLYVNIISGDKKGQWVLKINASGGNLIKAMKVNPKSDTRSFVFGKCLYDPITKELFIAGNIYSEQQIDFEQKKNAFEGLNKLNSYFFTRIDSTFENIYRNEKTLPYVFAVAQKNAKESFFYHSKIKEIYKTGSSDYRAYFSLYKSTADNLVFSYETGYFADFSLFDNDVEFYQDKIQVFSHLFTGVSDKNEFTGQFKIENVLKLDELITKQPVSDIEKIIGRDEMKNPKWIILQQEASGKKVFNTIRIGLKGPEKKIILESSRQNHPEIFKINNDKLILFNSEIENGFFRIKVASW